MLGEDLVAAVPVAEPTSPPFAHRSRRRHCRARRGRCGAASEDRGRRCTSARAGATASRRRHRGGRERRPTPAHRWSTSPARRSAVGGVDRAGPSVGTPPGSRRSRRCGHRPRARSSIGIVPGRCSTQARQRLPSITPGATMAPVGHTSMHRRHEPQPSATGACGISAPYSAVVTTDPSTNQLPAPATSRLAFLPNQPSPPRYATSAVDDRVVVGEGDCPLAGAAKTPGDRSQPRPQRAIVVDPGVASDSRLGTGGPRGLLVGEIRPCGDDDRSGARHRSGRIGGAFGVAVGERHASIETRRPSSDQLSPRPIEHTRRSNTEMLDAVLARQRPELTERRQRLMGAHRISVRFPIGATRPTRGSSRPAPAGGSPAPSPGRRPRRHRCDAAFSWLRPDAGCRRIESLFGVFMGRS